jgi:hypothetical protein
MKKQDIIMILAGIKLGKVLIQLVDNMKLKFRVSIIQLVEN